MASFGEIYSLPESQTRDLQRCTDQEVISLLRKRSSSLFEDQLEALSQFSEAQTRIEKENSWYLFYSITSKFAAMEGLMTDHGTWWPRKSVSIPNTFQGKSCNSPKFVGSKTTMELKPTDGSKAVLGMTRYSLLTSMFTLDDGDVLYLDEGLALCHVYPLEGKAKGTRNRNGKRSRPEYALDPLAMATGVQEVGGAPCAVQASGDGQERSMLLFLPLI